MMRIVVSAGVVVGLAAALAATVGAGESPRAVQEGAAPELSMRGKVVLVTGSTDGLGREVALRTAALGARVIVHGRNRARGDEVVREIGSRGGSARFYAADFASLAQVRDFAATVLRDHDRLDVLVNNAGVLINSGRQVSADGHEMHFAVNYLSGYLLTRLLLPRIVESAPSRIVNVASGAQSPIDFGDVMLTRPGRAAQGYAQSKLAQVMFTFDLARELDGKDVAVVALHPATMMDTTMVRASGMRPRSTVDEGATAVMHLVATPGLMGGQYFDGLEASRAHAQAYDEDARRQLRALSEDLTRAAR